MTKRKTFKDAKSVVLKQNAGQNIIHFGPKHLIIAFQVINLERWVMMFRKDEQKSNLKKKLVTQFKISL